MSHSTIDTSEPFAKGSLNREMRTRRMHQIMDENLFLLDRITKKKPNYSFVPHIRQHERLLHSISKFPYQTSVPLAPEVMFESEADRLTWEKHEREKRKRRIGVSSQAMDPATSSFPLLKAAWNNSPERNNPTSRPHTAAADGRRGGSGSGGGRPSASAGSPGFDLDGTSGSASARGKRRVAPLSARGGAGAAAGDEKYSLQPSASEAALLESKWRPKSQGDDTGKCVFSRDGVTISSVPVHLAVFEKFHPWRYEIYAQDDVCTTITASPPVAIRSAQSGALFCAML